MALRSSQCSTTRFKRRKCIGLTQHHRCFASARQKYGCSACTVAAEAACSLCTKERSRSTPSMRAALVAAALLQTTALQPRPIQVVVDVDDTVKSSGNVRILDIPLGGIDAQYERGEFYPGVCDFCFELASACLLYTSPSPRD